MSGQNKGQDPELVEAVGLLIMQKGKGQSFHWAPLASDLLSLLATSCSHICCMRQKSPGSGLIDLMKLRNKLTRI